ncbi:hypothetical protein Y032_0018g3662 [Ancylostoma ceylanicum]|nr:hypothetical protein Y032_0018g3662 [Ancylostoma ceylanicum]
MPTTYSIAVYILLHMLPTARIRPALYSITVYSVFTIFNRRCYLPRSIGLGKKDPFEHDEFWGRPYALSCFCPVV